MHHRTCCSVLLLTVLAGTVARGQDDEALREMARKAQDPLGDVKALMTDNTIAFDGGPDDDTSYNFQLQPVYSIDNSTRFNMIARAIIPIMGFEPGVVYPPIGPEPRPPSDSTWGLSDIMLQYFFSPKSDGAVKWGIGPQASLRTRTGDRQAGPGWGGGLAAVVFGGIDNWSLGLIGMQHWGQDSFSLGSLQVTAIYSIQALPGAYVGYNNSLNFNWNAGSRDKATIPLGATFGRTLLLGNGDGLDLSVGAYGMVEKPDNAPEWQLKFGISYFFN